MTFNARGKDTPESNRRRRSALEQIGIELQPDVELTNSQVKMAAQAARALTGQEKGPKGRPPVPIDLELLENLATIHCTREEMALVLNVTEKVLDRPELHAIIVAAKAKGKRGIRHAQFREALKGNTTMLVWLGKNILDQRDDQHVELTGAAGGPIEVASPRDELVARIERIAQRRITACVVSDEA